jgi:hypothetical protein
MSSGAANEPKNPLGTWLDDRSLTVAEFTRMMMKNGSHVTRYTVDLWLLEESTPNLRNAYAIQQITEGDVTMEELARYSLGEA